MKQKKDKKNALISDCYPDYNIIFDKNKYEEKKVANENEEYNEMEAFYLLKDMTSSISRLADKIEENLINLGEDNKAEMIINLTDALNDEYKELSDKTKLFKTHKELRNYHNKLLRIKVELQAFKTYLDIVDYE